MTAALVTVAVEPIAAVPVEGEWCPDCQLPSLIRVTMGCHNRVLVAGRWRQSLSVSSFVVCHDCGRTVP